VNSFSYFVKVRLLLEITGKISNGLRNPIEIYVFLWFHFDLFASTKLFYRMGDENPFLAEMD
jgi:hypothetical protein